MLQDFALSIVVHTASMIFLTIVHYLQIVIIEFIPD